MMIVLSNFSCSPLDSATVLRPEDYSVNDRRDILIFTRDGREIEFGAGNHHMVKKGDSLFIFGAGSLRRIHGSYVGKPYVGEIPREQIDRIELPRSWDPIRFGGVLLALCIIIPLGYYGLR